MAGFAQVADPATPWSLPFARALPALVLGAVVAFSADHSASLGLLSLGLFAAITGVILIGSALRVGSRGIVRSVTLAQGVVSAAVGVGSLALTSGGLPFMVFMVTTFAAITGLLELYLGLRGRRRNPRSRLGSDSARDWLFVGALTTALAIVTLLIPPGFSQPYTGPDGVTRELTASVVLVGILGAYWVVVGVYLVIAGLSIRWSADADRSTTPVVERSEA